MAERFVPPVIIDSPKLTSGLMTGELFGPFLPVVPVNDVDEAIKIMNSKHKPLAQHFFGDAKGKNCEKVKR